MPTTRVAVPARSVLLSLALAAAAVTGCSPAAPAPDGPGATVQAALGKLGAKDIDGLRTLACAGQEDLVRQQLGLGGVTDAAQLLPGVDTQALLDAITMDVTGIRMGDPAVTGDVATVPVTGSAKVTFDPVAMRPIVKQVLEQRGQTMSDDQLDALLKSLAAYGQDVPVDQTVRLVRENGAWKICQQTIASPAP